MSEIGYGTCLSNVICFAEDFLLLNSLKLVNPRSPEEAPQFETFYSLYPRKIAKKDALKAWHRLTAKQQEKALEAIPKHLRYWNLSETDKPFIPYPATWLNGWRFEDEIEEPVDKNQKAWHETASGIEAMGKSLGLEQADYEHFPAFKAAVMRAKGA